ncbi:hypothetical protein ACI0X9_003292 [Cronobacter turicensis]
MQAYFERQSKLNKLYDKATKPTVLLLTVVSGALAHTLLPQFFNGGQSSLLLAMVSIAIAATVCFFTASLFIYFCPLSPKEMKSALERMVGIPCSHEGIHYIHTIIDSGVVCRERHHSRAWKEIHNARNIKEKADSLSADRSYEEQIQEILYLNEIKEKKMTKTSDLALVKDAMHKVALISSPVTKQVAADALIELVESGQLRDMVLFVEAVLTRKPDAYIESRDLSNVAPGSRIQIILPSEGESFALSAYTPVFIGNYSGE